MWLKRLLKTNATGPAGGAGGDLGVAGDNVMGTHPGQGTLFEEDPPNREERYNTIRRRRKRKMLERKRKWRSSRDQYQNP